MVLRALYTRSVTTTLRDFTIQGAAELGPCAGAQSFRAVRRDDGGPVLLHKFRPAQSLIELEPLVMVEEPPDFTKPFVSQFTDLFVAAGSAYLVEPLPPCVALGDLWRYVLQKRPDQALTVIEVVVRQLLSILRGFIRQDRYHGAVTVENIVLAPTASFGILTAHLPCREGRLWLRRAPKTPARSDFRAFTDILHTLLNLETQIAALQNVPGLLPAALHRRIREILCEVEQVTIRAN